jgi:hypothetical protein
MEWNVVSGGGTSATEARTFAASATQDNAGLSEATFTTGGLLRSAAMVTVAVAPFQSDEATSVFVLADQVKDSDAVLDYTSVLVDQVKDSDAALDCVSVLVDHFGILINEYADGLYVLIDREIEDSNMYASVLSVSQFKKNTGLMRKYRIEFPIRLINMINRRRYLGY